MIQPQQLRIGNFVFDSRQNTEKVFELSIFGDLHRVNELYPEAFNPIPLTEEILLKFGFYEIYKSEFSIRYGIENFDEIEFKWNKTFGWNFYYKTFCIEGIKYVHQLQNLFFSLCGEELTFK